MVRVGGDTAENGSANESNTNGLACARKATCLCSLPLSSHLKKIDKGFVVR